MSTQDERYNELIAEGMTRKAALAQIQTERDAGTLAGTSSASSASADPYGTSGVANQSVRRRGSSEQQRVGQDTRVRDDASSGTAGASGSGIGKAMAESSGSPVGQPAQGGSLWTAARQPTDLASIQQRVLQSFTKPVQRGQ